MWADSMSESVNVNTLQLVSKRFHNYTDLHYKRNLFFNLQILTFQCVNLN